MRLFLTALSCCILLFSYCQAPSIQWQRSFGGSGSDGGLTYEGFFSVCQSYDNGSIIAGGTYSTNGYASDNHGDEDILMLKLDGDGNVVWHKCLGGSGPDFPKSVKQTFDSGYIVVATTSSNNGDVSGNHGQQDAWVVRLDSAGNILWQRCLGGSNFEYGYDVQQTADSGYVIACATNSTDGDITGGLHGLDDYWIIKLDKDGGIEWQKLFGGSYNDDPYGIEKTFDGGYIVAGYTNSFDGNVTGYHGGAADCWIVKLDASGNLQWQKCVGGSLRDEGRSIKQTADSGYVVAVLTISNDGDVTGNHGSTDYFVAKLDKDGDISWKKCFGGSGAETVHDVQVANGYYIVTGASNSVNGDVTGNHGSFDYWILKIDTTGNITWETSLGGESDDEAFSLSYKPDEGYIVGGETNSHSGDVTDSYGDYDFWILKLEDDNVLPVKLLSFTAQKQKKTTLLQWQTTNEINNNYFSIERSPDLKVFSSIGTRQGLNTAYTNNYSFTDYAPLNGINYYRLKQFDKDGKYTYSHIVSVECTNGSSSFAIYPNPATNNVDVIIPLVNSVSEIDIYDITGRKVITETLLPDENSKPLDISKLSAGIYTVVLIQKGKQQTIKLVKK